MVPPDSFGFRVNALLFLRFDALNAVLLAIVQFHCRPLCNVWIVADSRATFLSKISKTMQPDLLWNGTMLELSRMKHHVLVLRSSHFIQNFLDLEKEST